MLATPSLADPLKIAPAPFPPPRDSCDLIWRLAEACATLTRLDRVTTAKSLQDDVLSICECWYSEVAADGATEAARAGFTADLRMLLAWAEKTIRTVEVELMEQLTAARAHCDETAAAIDLECGF